MNSAFLASNQFHQFAWDSTSLGLFKMCERKYYYEVICGYRSSGQAIDLEFGIHYHKLLERHDGRLALGVPFEESQAQLVRDWFCIGNHKSELNTQTGEISEPVWFHWDTDDSNKNASTLLRSALWYSEDRKDDVLKTVVLPTGKPAVELSFRYEIDVEAEPGRPYILCGHLDKLVHFGEQMFFLDHKTTKTTVNSDYFKRYSVDNQMSMYSIASKVVFGTEVAGGIIDAAQIAVNFTRFERGFVHRNPDQLDEWLWQTLKYIKRAQDTAQEAKVLADAGEDPSSAYLMNDKACFLCAFRDHICSKSPKVRKPFLDANYSTSPWDPLVPR